MHGHRQDEERDRERRQRPRPLGVWQPPPGDGADDQHDTGGGERPPRQPSGGHVDVAERHLEVAGDGQLQRDSRRQRNRKNEHADHPRQYNRAPDERDLSRREADDPAGL